MGAWFRRCPVRKVWQLNPLVWEVEMIRVREKIATREAFRQVLETVAWTSLMLILLSFAPSPASAGTVTAHVVALDQFITYNRLGAVNPTGMIFALRRDVVEDSPGSPTDGLPESEGGVLAAGQVRLRDDKRPRPIVLRVNEGDTLTIHFQNLLDPNVPAVADPVSGIVMDDQPATRSAGVHVYGLQLADSIASDGSYVGQNGNSLVPPGGTAVYNYYAEKESAYLLSSTAVTTGGEGNIGSHAFGLFGMVNVEPAGSIWYRSQLTEAEMRLATTGLTPLGQPILDYEAHYPADGPNGPWALQGKAGLPILKILDDNEIVHSDLNAVIAGAGVGGRLGKNYPDNPTYPDRQQPFREFSVVFHDEIKAIQAFDLFRDETFKHTLHSVRDGFAINYGTGGIGAEIIANRLGVGPMKDCVDCKYEEFFLTSWAVGDPAMIVDVPANASDPESGDVATKAFYPDDPANVFHSYLNDHVKIRNVHIGGEHHIFHLHAHQWLFTPDDDNSSYLDSQAVGPGSAYTYEIAYNGSGNRNKTAGDSIFHCHFYPHFAQGMWALWRVHDVFEKGTVLASDGRPMPGARALPDGEIMAGTPIPGVVPLPGRPMAPMPGAAVQIVEGQVVVTPLNNGKGGGKVKGGGKGKGGGTQEPVPLGNPGYPFFVPGVAGHRPPTPPLDLVADGGLERHVIVGGSAHSVETPYNFEKELIEADAQFLPETGTETEMAAMAFHAQRLHDTFTPDGFSAQFETNGLPPRAGAPYAEPCRNDDGTSRGAANRTYRAAVIELDILLNKVGWHFNQSRIITLEQDVGPTLAGTRPPEPFVMRANTGDCVDYYHTNLVPSVYQQDDFQVKTPTDVIGQHIHLVKFDVMSADGSANGWNYEDGTFSPDEVVERIDAINAFNVKYRPGTPPLAPEPGFRGVLGARTTIQRWYVDAVTNNQGEDRGLGNVYTHDHFGPSTHQQAGLYATLLTEPAGSSWRDPDTGVALGGRGDGGPTSWNADILAGGNSYREFYFEFADFQLAYATPGLPRAQGGNAVPVNPPGMVAVGLPFLLERPAVCPNGDPNTVGCPEAISADEVGTFTVNYRNEPLPLRVRDPGSNSQANGLAGDISLAFSSHINRMDANLNSQPGFYPPLTADVGPRDPFTPMLRAYDGDTIRIRAQVGAQEEGHNMSVHGQKWLQEYASPNSGYRNAQMMGISEQFQFIAPIVLANTQAGNRADYLYSTDASVDGYWNGGWGLLRTYDRLRGDLPALPNNRIGSQGLRIRNAGDFTDLCPNDAPVRAYDVTAVAAQEALPGGTLVYNSRGSLHDPTAILYVLTADLNADGTLKPSAPVEPLILRAAAGECIEVTLRNDLPEVLPDLDGFNTMPPIIDHFNANQVVPSNKVGLHAQLVAYDVTKSDGANVGINNGQLVAPDDTEPKVYRWYAGDVRLVDGNLMATPMELGAINLISSDRIKHSNKGAIGALIIEPEGSNWVTDLGTRASATVTKSDASTFREFVVLHQDDINLRYNGNQPVPIVGVEHDAEDTGQRALNYRTEPLWQRLGYAPDANEEFTRTLDFTDALSNNQVGGDPETPVFTAIAGDEVRFRVLQPGGHARNSSVTLHGHSWQRMPYVNDSKRIGNNILSNWIGVQEGHGPANHFDIVPTHGAGGKYSVTGDYLYRDLTPSHFDNGSWAIFRVQ